MNKTLKKRKGFKNRHIDPLPKKEATIKVVINDPDAEQIMLCNWKPIEPKNYKSQSPPSIHGKGYLGTATVIDQEFKGIGFHAWEQNNTEFVYYSVID